MTIAQVVLQNLAELPVEKQVEVLDFVQFLRKKDETKPMRRNPIGLFADFNIDITEEEIAEARKEMWGNFPRDFGVSE